MNDYTEMKKQSSLQSNIWTDKQFAKLFTFKFENYIYRNLGRPILDQIRGQIFVHIYDKLNK